MSLKFNRKYKKNFYDKNIFNNDYKKRLVFRKNYNDSDDDDDEDEESYDSEDFNESFRNKLSFNSKKDMNLNDVANNIMKKNVNGKEKKDQLITEIHKDLNFLRNSINLMI
jgi:hypothetical protein